MSKDLTNFLKETFMSTDLPARFQLKNITRFHDTIEAIINTWPIPVVVDPKPLALETYAARLRDALRSHRLYKWNDDQFGSALEKLDIIVVIRKGCIIAGDEAKVLAKGTGPVAQAGTPISEISANQIQLHDAPPLAVIEALCVLITYEALKDHIIITGWQLPDLAPLETRYNVSLTELEPNKILLL